MRRQAISIIPQFVLASLFAGCESIATYVVYCVAQKR
jgi:hypothetical protein